MVQQSSMRDGLLRRAVVRQGALRITVDYDSVVLVPVARRADRIVSLVTTLTGSPPAAAQETSIRAFTASQQHWPMFALKLLSDNTSAASCSM